jgi:hypothetical protein
MTRTRPHSFALSRTRSFQPQQADRIGMPDTKFHLAFRFTVRPLKLEEIAMSTMQQGGRSQASDYTMSKPTKKMGKAFRFHSLQ